jgi:hypothetical protein
MGRDGGESFPVKHFSSQDYLPTQQDGLATAFRRSYTFCPLFRIAHTIDTWQNQYVQATSWIVAKFCKERVE